MIDPITLARENIQKLTAYTSARDEFSGEAKVFLDANENPFGELNRYPDPYQNELKQLLAEISNVKPSQLFVGNGSDEIIDLVFRIFCNPGKDKALTFSPTYGMYQVSADINDVELLTCPLDDQFEIDLDTAFKTLNDTSIKLILICSPNNPTGNRLNKDRIIELLENFNGIVLVDEAYGEFDEDQNLDELISEYGNLIISKTMSKAWGLAGARVGYALTNSSILELLNKVKPPYNVSTLNQVAAIKAIRKKQEFEKRKAIILSERERMIKELTSLVNVISIFPSNANFLLVAFEDALSTYDYLLSKGIVVRNRDKLVKNCLRLTIGTETENNQLIQALKSMKS